MLVKRQVKNAMLSMIGVFNKEERRQWSIYEATLEDDLPVAAGDNLRVVTGPNGQKEMRHCCRLMDNQAYAPNGLIVLYGDISNLRAMKRMLNNHLDEIKILSLIHI